MKLFKMLKVQLSGTVLDKVQHNLLCRACLDKCIVTISIYFLKPVLLQFSLLNFSYFYQNPLFGWLKKDSVKCLSKFPSKDSYRIRTARSQNCPLILFKKIKETRFSGRLLEFHFVLNIAKNSDLNSIFW